MKTVPIQQLFKTDGRRAIIHCLSILLCILYHQNAHAQTRFLGPDSTQPLNYFNCGSNTAYTQTHAISTSSGGNNQFTTVNNFPASAIEHCGKFDVYYEDLITGNPQQGFSDPITGATRRATLCTVLTYVQSVIDFSNVSASNPIRLYVDTSYSATVHPAPVGTSWSRR